MKKRFPFWGCVFVLLVWWMYWKYWLWAALHLAMIIKGQQSLSLYCHNENNIHTNINTKLLTSNRFGVVSFKIKVHNLLQSYQPLIRECKIAVKTERFSFNLHALVIMQPWLQFPCSAGRGRCVAWWWFLPGGSFSATDPHSPVLYRLEGGGPSSATESK